MLSNATLMAVSVFVLAGCLEVDNLGAKWDEGTVDPALSGEWLMKQTSAESDQNIKNYTFTPMGTTHYNLAPSGDLQDSMLAKTLDVGGMKFLMLKEPDTSSEIKKPGGAMWRYNLAVEIGDPESEADDKATLEFTRLVPAKSAEIEKLSGGLIMPRQAGDTSLYAIQVLDEASITALTALAADPTLWEVWASGEKVVKPE